jgi:transposase
MKKTPKETHNNIVCLLNNGLSSRQIAAQLGVSHTTVLRERAKSQTNAHEDKGGRPAKLTMANKRNLIRNITSGRIDTAVGLARDLKDSIGVEVGPDTVRRALKEAGMKAVTKKKKPYLQPRHIRQRLEFALRHQSWTVDDWKRVIWSDETKINRMGSDGRKWVWKKPSNTLISREIQPTMKFGGGNLMFWGCMTAKGVGYGCRIDGRMNADIYTSILNDFLLPTIKYYKLNKRTAIFQQDNDSKHSSQTARKWLETNKINILAWPPQSPDLNPMEHLWQHLKKKLGEYNTEPCGILELWERVEKEWDKIPVDICTKLIESMPKRIAEVLKAKGGYTNY